MRDREGAPGATAPSTARQAARPTGGEVKAGSSRDTGQGAITSCRKGGADPTGRDRRDTSSLEPRAPTLGPRVSSRLLLCVCHVWTGRSPKGPAEPGCAGPGRGKEGAGYPGPNRDPAQSRAQSLPAPVRAPSFAAPHGSDPQILAGVVTQGTRAERTGSLGDSQLLPQAAQPGLGVCHLHGQVLHVHAGAAAGVPLQGQGHDQLQRADRGVSPACSCAWHSARTASC